ncbi:hypothetical protein SAMN05444266_109221 [Chitinophaga jiangningensis]|uniref:Uncharacterized protein n=1 Tax=Chitinophaga jiangningensis TaxID=1419482 RepID=A0A1M7KA73_9BACT|nr:hypothetical protein [Chitinophaga jiangningensis]SHM62115.1 hypothetical protein SAMN05444266_109221 [Chitinophaga jiangningensis]
MSNIATYTFLPWMRSGVANKISSADKDPGVRVRATIAIKLKVEGNKPDGGVLTEPITKNIQLYGPGDIIGIEARAIIKTDPHNWITNFEPNYLPYVDFYDEDFPWRYTPAAPDNKDRLRPWITLVVLEEGAFKEATNIKDKPLPYITVDKAAEKFPPADQLWAWAHVHVNESMLDRIVSQPVDHNAVVNTLNNILKNDPDHANSRLLCPIKLKENTAYHAFIIPTFETGRLAGLGADMTDDNIPAAVFATMSAWADYNGRPDTASFPYYYRWHFRTGSKGDFEYLVRLLKPNPVDNRVGRRDMDTQAPGSNIHGIPELGGILRLGGALQVPFSTMKPADKEEVLKYNNWDHPGYPHAFQHDLAQFINLADDYTKNTSKDANSNTSLENVQDDVDPLITAPLYGRWHALTERLLYKDDGSNAPNNQNWIHQLNLDPRWRVAAGFGTKVIQTKQEDYMSAAWQQVGDILEANRRLRFGRFAQRTSYSWYEQHIATHIYNRPDKALQFTAPLQKRLLANNVTVYHQVDKSVLSRSLTSTTIRKVLRPGGRVMKLQPFTDAATGDNILTRVNSGEVPLVLPKIDPPALPTPSQLADAAQPATKLPPWLVSVLKQFKKWRIAVIILILLLLLVMLLSGFSPAVTAITGIAIVALIWFWLLAGKWEKAKAGADSIRPENQTPESVDDMPKVPNFEITLPGDNTVFTPGATDSAEAVIYKEAIKEAAILMQGNREEGRIPTRPTLDLPVLADTIFKAIDPGVTIPKLIFGGISIPERIRIRMVELFDEVMAYPVIDVPMYKPLTDISSELFLPNINLISQNTISLLETNQPFIEAYMVGVNHEFVRELVWREYPTDNRASSFRQFWDVSTFLNVDDSLNSEQLKEKLRDIPPLHKWSRYSKIGTHDNRETNGPQEEDVVLVIRGELLKKYPNAVIYAQKAQWQMKDGKIDNKVERILVPLSDAEEDKPPLSKVKTPLYEAKVSPDIYFFGFDLTASEAKGGDGTKPEDINNAGWFFCIKERPGECRFGLDIDADKTPNVWNDLGWDNLVPGAKGGEMIKINSSLGLTPPNLANEPEKKDQYDDDVNVTWNADMSAAEVAYILYQVPVLVAVHASEMLPKTSA